MPRKYFRKYLPHADTVRSSPLVKRFGRLLDHPGLWCLNRRSVAGGVAIGLFCGLIPGPFQMLGALLLAIPLRRNIPVALLVTFYTNPFTIVPLYLLAYGYGRLLIGAGEEAAVPDPFSWDWSDLHGSLQDFAAWTFALGKPLGVGLVALAVTLALLGYVAVDLAWRAHVIASWRARRRRGK